MKGKILGYSEADGSGAISAEDGSRHRFTRADWRGDKPPATGMVVDFESEGGAVRRVQVDQAGTLRVFDRVSPATAPDGEEEER